MSDNNSVLEARLRAHELILMSLVHAIVHKHDDRNAMFTAFSEHLANLGEQLVDEPTPVNTAAVESAASFQAQVHRQLEPFLQVVR